MLSDHQLSMNKDGTEMVSYAITRGNSIEAIVMTSSESLFARMEQKLWEFRFNDEVDNWEAMDKEIDTRLTG